MQWVFKLSIKTILILLFIGCLFRMPYGYYELVRFTGMVIFALLAYDSYEHRQDIVFPVIWGASALLINPFIKIALGRTIWNIIDVCWTVLLIITLITELKSQVSKNKNINQ